MKLIEKIEITHFRSFLGTPKRFETVINNLLDLNIFSGSNDSGKSNVLRALNVFFNDEIATGTPLDFERDFFWGKKDAAHRVIDISVSFNLSNDPKRDKFLPEKFKISKYFDRNGFRNYVYTFTLKEKDIEIKVDSRAEQNSQLFKKFISYKSTKEEKAAAEKREWNYRVKFAGFLNKSVSFEYVPAIRDKNFFSQLFGRVISRIKYNEDAKISELLKEKHKIINWESTVENKSEKKDLKLNLKSETWRKERIKYIDTQTKKEAKLAASMIELEKEINSYSSNLIDSINFLDSEFKIGNNLKDFFEGFDIATGAEKSILLSLRGDGIQAKFVPKILDFLSTVDAEKKYFIWGFEEPENSAEYKNQQQLANEFKNNFRINKQIFVTTHSEEFLQMYDSRDVPSHERVSNLYHIKKCNDSEFGEYSQAYLFDVDKNEFEFATQKTLLDEDLGQSYLRAKHSKELKQFETSFLEEMDSMSRENAKLNEKIMSDNKPMVFVEDQYDRLYKIAWLKLNNVKFEETNIDEVFVRKCPFAIHKAEGASALEGFLRMPNPSYLSEKKIIGLLDFDVTGVKVFHNIKNNTYWKGACQGDKITGFYKKRADHPCFYVLLLPIPMRLDSLAGIDYPSYIEIENLLPEAFLIQKSFVREKTTTGNTKYFETFSDKKSTLWKSTIMLDASNFADFKPLFDKIELLFNI